MISEENTNDLLFENKTTINSKEEFFEIEKIYVNSQKKPYYFLKLFVFFFIIGIVAGVLRDPIEFVICMILFALISVSYLMRSKKQLNASLEKLYSENRALIEGVEKTNRFYNSKASTESSVNSLEYPYSDISQVLICGVRMIIIVYTRMVFISLDGFTTGNKFDFLEHIKRNVSPDKIRFLENKKEK